MLRRALPLLALLLIACTHEQREGMDAGPNGAGAQAAAGRNGDPDGRDAAMMDARVGQPTAGAVSGDQPRNGSDGLSAGSGSPFDGTIDAATDATIIRRYDASIPRYDASSDASALGDGGFDLLFSDAEVFSLPINSLRYGVTGYVPTSGLCISVIWYLRSVDETRFCELVDQLGPYVVVEESDRSGCWGYGGNASLFAQRGCVDFGALNDDTDDSVDLEVDISHDLFTGTVRFKK